MPGPLYGSPLRQQAERRVLRRSSHCLFCRNFMVLFILLSHGGHSQVSTYKARIGIDTNHGRAGSYLVLILH